MTDFIRGFKKEMGLTMYGVDVLVEEVTGKYTVIDVNYFPSY